MCVTSNKQLRATENSVFSPETAHCPKLEQIAQKYRDEIYHGKGFLRDKRKTKF